MFFSGILAYLAESVWTLILHLSSRGSFPKPLDAEEEEKLIKSMFAGDTAARDKLIEHNLRLVAHIAKKYAQNAYDKDDLVSIGSIGLIKAVHTFRPQAGKLTTYASRCIENEILMHLRANRKTRNNVSLDAGLGLDKEGNEMLLSELLGTDKDSVPDEVALNIDGRIAMHLIDQLLDSREKKVINMRFGIEDGVFHPQHEVAETLGISRSYVSRIEKKALEKLRKHML